VFFGRSSNGGGREYEALNSVEELMTKSRRWIAQASVFTATLLAVGWLGGSAMAATKVAAGNAQAVSGAVAGPDVVAPGYFMLYNVSTEQCLQEDGTTSAAYGGGCPSTKWENSLVNHSLAWSATSATNFSLKNEHSGKCLIVSSTSTSVSAGACTGTAQEWNEFVWVNSAGVPLGSGFQNVGDGLILAENPSTGGVVVISTSSSDAYSWGNWFVDDLS
jgi:hypothetical protein